MKKIVDQRFTFLNLQHIKIAYIIQTLGVLLILGHDFLKGGLEKMKANSLWVLFILSSVVYGYLSLSISVEQEKEIKRPFRSFLLSLFVLLVIGSITAYLTSVTSGFNWSNGVLFGGIIFVCGLIAMNYAYHLRKNNKMNGKMMNKRRPCSRSSLFLRIIHITITRSNPVLCYQYFTLKFR